MTTYQLFVICSAVSAAVGFSVFFRTVYDCLRLRYLSVPTVILGAIFAVVGAVSMTKCIELIGF
jgi:hypothetical protein